MNGRGTAFGSTLALGAGVICASWVRTRIPGLAPHGRALIASRPAAAEPEHGEPVRALGQRAPGFPELWAVRRRPVLNQRAPGFPALWAERAAWSGRRLRFPLTGNLLRRIPLASIAGGAGAFAAMLLLVGAGALLIGPRVIGWTGLVVLSGSMEPAMPVGSLALVQPVDADSIEAGDIITFSRPGDARRLVSHRVTAVEPDGFRTKGDANSDSDGWVVPRDSLTGEVRFVAPHLGDVSQFLHTREGFLLLMVLPALLAIAGEVENIVRELRRGRRMARATA